MDFSFYAFVVLLFAAVVLAVEGSYLWWSATHGKEARKIASRLHLMSGGQGGSIDTVSILKQRRLSNSPLLERLLNKVPHIGKVDHMLLQSGLRWSVTRLIQLTVVVPIAAFLLLRMLHLQSLLVTTLTTVCVALPVLQVRRARVERLRKIEEQLPEVADFLARALRAGHAFTNALQMVGEEFPEPISGEFRATHEEINYGVPMHTALTNLAARVPLTDLGYLVIAVLIQRESGGNLAELLGNVGRIIRDRLKLLGQVRVLSAEGRMSAWVLGILPFAVAFAMHLTKPEYLALLWQTPTVARLLTFSLTMAVFSIFWMRNIIRIRV